MQSQRRYKHEFLINIIVAMVILISIPIVGSGFYSFTVAKNSIKNELIIRNNNMLIQTSNTIDMLVEEIDKAAMQLTLDYDINIFLNKTSVDDYNAVNRILKKITSLGSVNSNIYSVYVNYENTRKIFSSRDGMYSFNDFYDKDWNGELAKTDFYSVLNTRKIREKDGTEMNVISVIRPLPMTVDGQRKGTLVININEDTIHGFIRDLSRYNGEDIFITDSNGNILSSADKAQMYSNLESNVIEKIISRNDGFFIETFKGNSSHFAFSKSRYNDWYYVSVIPLKVLYAELNKIRNVTIVAAAIIIVIGIIISWLVSKKIYKPINSIVQFVCLNTEQKATYCLNEVQLIEKGVKDALLKRNRLEDKHKKNLPLLKQTLFQNLIGGLYKDITFDISVELAEAGIEQINFEYYVLGVLRLNRGLNSDSKATNVGSIVRQLKVKEILESYTGDNCWIETIDSMSVGILFSLNSTEDLIEQLYILKDILTNALEDISNRLGINSWVGLSRLYNNVKFVSDAYEDALCALEYKTVCSNNVIIDIEEIEHSTFFDRKYIIDIQDKAVRYLRMGQAENSITEISKVLDYFKGNNVSDKNIYLILTEIINIKHYIAKGTHAYNDELRQAAVNWFKVILKGEKPDFITETEITVEQEETLWCTQCGQVLGEFTDARSTWELNIDYLDRNKYCYTADIEIVREKMERVLNMPDIREKIFPRFISNVIDKNGIESTNVFFFSEEGIVVAGIYMSKAGINKGNKCTILLLDGGTNDIAVEGELIDRFLRGGDVFVFDSRGIGAVKSKVRKKHPSDIHGAEFKMTCDAHMMKSSLVGLRVYDITRACEFIRQFYPDRKIQLAGKGISSLYALFAAVLTGEVESIYLEDMICSFENIVRTKYYKHDVRIELCGVLKEFDIPELISILEKDKIICNVHKDLEANNI